MSLDRRADLYESCLRISTRHPDYATIPIQDGFDWSPLADSSFDQLYLVVFRSARRPTADLALLREHDDHAYAEALESGGLLRYFKGHANELGECLSFCLWETREQAGMAAGAASHKSATDITAQMYVSYVVDRYWVKKVKENLIFEHIQSDSKKVSDLL